MDQHDFKPKASTSNSDYNNDELRIVMVGKTGIGKSATGNSILGRECFESKFSARSMTVDCSKGKGSVCGQRVAVIDTPGLFDTRFGMDKTSRDICQCISYASPGPHIFLVVIRLGRYTDEEQHTVQRIQEIFGQAADKYSMVLFTGGDLLEGTIEQFLAESPQLQELVARCNNQFHVFNNKSRDPSQVEELLQKIRGVVRQNGGSHYTNEMFQEAERAIEEEKQRIMKEKEKKMQKEQEAMESRLKAKYDREIQRIRQDLRVQREQERKEMEQERERQRDEMNEERKREREEERKREREDKEMELCRLKEQFDRDLQEKICEIKIQYETVARDHAETLNPLYPLVKAGKVILGGIELLGNIFGQLFK